ncbi:MAG: alpha-hydroxy-acid oxidizing protein [Actinobacteria bacterium]|jgi:L-lactate dehydrogenase (cytochrome)|nr:alpha-hydroxy-acid oxidizing protein [Actinomycetota bacterium]NBQ59624.1 alpha-hydroxy-acid oxidizing protein [Actinomycetota bacterium]NBY83010.1 alpha-hydroxy-acid oxidizing protein [Actinomycetota bacterium]NCA25384.1 alpha-hydroxy-acid oxidizing protein [Actinomycetota bacterium]NCU77863.1 alpha-hydroxy-acid oxidizing protein [Actinomycetota bacterium]
MDALPRVTGVNVSTVKVKRRIPSPKDLAQLLRFRKFIFSSKKRRLSKALTIYDLRDIAKRRTPQAPFDYTDGGADSESSLDRARAAYEKLEFQPKILKNVKNVDLSVKMLGKVMSMPLGIAPTGFTRMMQTEGEYAGACAAADAGIPYTLSTMGTRSIEDVAAAAPTGRNWFQLYMWKDRDRSMALVDRAKQAGFDTLVLTVDVPVAGARLRDVRNGMTIPPSLTAKTIINAIPRPAWWINFLTTDPLKFASLDSWNGTVAELLDSMFDPTVTYEDLKWIREQWNGNLVVKGIQNVGDAVKSIESGADAIILSNHGGRQLDRAPVPLHLLPEVVKEVGNKAEVHVDTGIMHGQDVVAALASGAKFTWIGRAYLYGLMAGGKSGVDKSLEIFRTQITRTMKLLGVSSVAELNPEHVRFIARYADN